MHASREEWGWGLTAGQVCQELRGEVECRALEGSVLSPHDDRDFVLRVQIGDRVVTRWNLPDAMLAGGAHQRPRRAGP